jgi:hypothetical protein
MNKNKLLKAALIVLVLFALANAAAIAVIQLSPHYVYVTVEEAISITPSFLTPTLYVGESGTANFTVHNAANVNIPLNVTAKVTVYPTNATATDLALTYPSVITAAPGDNILAIQFSLTTGAIAGNYTITVTTTRV